MDTPYLFFIKTTFLVLFIKYIYGETNLIVKSLIELP